MTTESSSSPNAATHAVEVEVIDEPKAIVHEIVAEGKTTADLQEPAEEVKEVVEPESKEHEISKSAEEHKDSAVAEPLQPVPINETAVEEVKVEKEDGHKANEKTEIEERDHKEEAAKQEAEPETPKPEAQPEAAKPEVQPEAGISVEGKDNSADSASPEKNTHSPSHHHHHTPAHSDALKSDSQSSPKTPPPMKKGFLKKQGQENKLSWRKRYFVLNEGVVNYYEKPHDKPPFGLIHRGEVCLVNLRIEEKGIMLILNCKDTEKEKGERELVVEVKDAEERAAWKAAFIQHAEHYHKG